MESLVDPSVQSSVMNGMSIAAAAASDTRTRGFDQLAKDSTAVWTSALVNPTMWGAEAAGLLNRTRINPTPVQQNPSLTKPE